MVKLLIPIKSDHNNEDLLNEQTELNDLTVESKFGRSLHFLVYDTKNEDTKIILNQNQHFGGNIPPHILAKENNIDFVLAAHMGYHLYLGFKNNNISILQVDINKSVTSLINDYKQNRLFNLQEPKVGACCSKNH
jgi:predicted Fe-Mo cluster-binding NifX family protein